MKLIEILQRSEKDQENAQVKRVVATVEMAQQSFVNKYKKQVIDLEGQLEDHLDVTVKKITDADGWVNKLHQVKIDLEMAKKNLQVAEESYTQLFS